MTRRVPGGHRAGAVTILVVVLLLGLVAAGLYMLERARRQRFADSHRFSRGSVAQSLAHSGLNLGWGHLIDATKVPGHALRTDLVLARPEAVRDARFPIDIPPLRAALEPFDGDASLEVELAVESVQALFAPDPAGGIRFDPREKTGDLILRATGEYRGVRRTLVARRRFHTVPARVPVISKFTLFVHERGPRDPNSLAYDRLRPEEGFRRDGEPARPLVLFHRPERFPAVLDGEFAPLATMFEGYELDAGGLVYLGGEGWGLSLVHGPGAGRYEELHLVRRMRYRGASNDPALPPEDAIFSGFYDGVFADRRFGDLGDEDRLANALDGDPVTDLTADLHLSGDTSAVTPTVVLGDVRRRYLRQGLLGGSGFGAVGTGARPPDGFAGGADLYDRVTPGVTEEPYNRTWDYLRTNRESLTTDLLSLAADTPITPTYDLRPGALARVRPAVPDSPGYLYPPPDSPDADTCELVRVGGGPDAPIFSGGLRELTPGLIEEVLRRRVTHTFADAGEFMAAAAEWRDLEGVFALARGDLELTDLRFRGPTVLLVPGNIAVRGPVLQAAAGAPLSLVSLAGDIYVETPEPVDAHLVALRGRFRSRGKLQVVGGVAAGRLELEEITAGPETKSIHYNPVLDPTDGVLADRLFILGLSRGVEVAFDTPP